MTVRIRRRDPDRPWRRRCPRAAWREEAPPLRRHVPPRPPRGRARAGATWSTASPRWLVARRRARRSSPASSRSWSSSSRRFCRCSRRRRSRPIAGVAAARPATSRALVADEYGSHVAALDLSGRVRVVRLRDHAVVAERVDPPPDAPRARLDRGRRCRPETTLLTAATADRRRRHRPGEVAARSFEGERAGVGTRSSPTPVVVSVDPARRPLVVYAVGAGEGERPDRRRAAGRRHAGRWCASRYRENEFTRRGDAQRGTPHRCRARYAHAAACFDHEQRNLFGANERGELLLVAARRRHASGRRRAASPPAGAPVTALTMLIGGRSLVVGQADGVARASGSSSRSPTGGARLTRIRDFPPLPGAVHGDRAVARATRASSRRRRSGEARPLLLDLGPRAVERPRRRSPGSALALAPKGTARFVAGDGAAGRARRSTTRIPRSVCESLFGHVWYEGYAKPEYVWQSSSGSDDFEPKLSLTPLLVGTLKGTLYSLLHRHPAGRPRRHVPLAVHAPAPARRWSSRRSRSWRRCRASCSASSPACGWRRASQQMFPGAAADAVVLFPLLIIAAGAAWHARAAAHPRPLPGRQRGRARSCAVLAFGLWLSLALSRRVERLVFGGNFQAWLLADDRAALRPAQRHRRRPGDGLRGHPDHLRDRRGRLLQRAARSGRPARWRWAPTAGRR